MPKTLKVRSGDIRAAGNIRFGLGMGRMLLAPASGAGPSNLVKPRTSGFGRGVWSEARGIEDPCARFPTQCVGATLSP